MVVDMSTQIAVRVPDELLAEVDRAAADGGSSRAAVVVRALEHYRMRLLAERDAAILAETGDYDELAGLAGSASLDVD